MEISIQTAGRRTYIVGNTYPYRDAIRAIGAKWDADRKAWWIGKRAEAEDLVARLAGNAGQATNPAPSDKAPGEDATVAGRAKYKGKTYYIAGRVERGRTSYDDSVSAVTSRDGGKVLLYARDGSFQFWAARDAIQTEKSYDRPQTIDGLRRYAERLRKSGDSPEIDACRRRGWDGVIGSQSYYSSGAFDEIDE